MKLKRKKQSQQASDGAHSAVCADVPDVGIKQTKWGPRQKLKIVHVIDERDQEGRPIQVHDLYGASIHESSRFYKAVRAILGREPEFDNADEFDVNSLVGRCYQITTARRTTAKGVYANVTGIRSLPAGAQRVAIPLDFVRAKDQPQQIEPLNNSNGGLTSRETVDYAVEFPGD